jgi:hypothetical protein
LTKFNEARRVDRRSVNLIHTFAWGVLRFDPASVAISEGLDTGEVVVTAGVQALHPGQKVRLLGSEP